MRSPICFLLLAFTFCLPVLAQSEAGFGVNLGPGLKKSAGVAGVARSRVVTETPDVRVPESSEAGKLERKIFEMLNGERRAQGLGDLEWNDQVAAVARLHSYNMAQEKFFSHRGSDGSMVDDRADRLGLGQWRTIGENIAYMRGYDDPASLAVEKWMESTAHRKNLLASTWRESAVGVAITADGTYYLTQVFLLRK